MKDKILFVITSHGELGNTGKKTGYWLSEVTHPWSILDKDYDIDVVSPKGGKCPVDGFDLTDPINRKYWDDPKWREKIDNTLKPENIKPDIYRAIFYAGGHGAMWDFPDNQILAAIAGIIHDKGGYVAAVCHGPAGLLNIPVKEGGLLIEDKQMVCFTNEEELLNGTSAAVPFMLQSELEKHYCIFENKAPWSDQVVISGKLVTGQNPQSALSLGKALAKLLAG